ncbi:hypothetical protein C4K38_2138 [Pseudomonas chlororaphis subsp. piscium]|uniref:helix-turn-helix domain-containing protein n=1 Tax=Pseudomonas chlororaphis TaxID=587753 RepID=UPI0006A62574|nr:helix-turn-helix domain-containing protein [Pseudomonas chlororaphis]AZC30098.1 hypothetical protein C4K38_2138 [Pseudomonas chlororaphis subsp. piscium]WDG94027.1 helix-turn-helix domain-containing protein [Pseudomonas chlororaphis]SDT25009.1 DNA binding domain-containing protein, excisionase family [Pseudomonas chlororaphis]
MDKQDDQEAHNEAQMTRLIKMLAAGIEFVELEVMLKALDDHRSAPREKRKPNKLPTASWSLPDGKISYSIAEAAHLIGVKTSTVTGYLNVCGLPSFRLGKRRLILADELQKWLRMNAAEGRVDTK